MAESGATPLRAASVVEAFHRCGFTHIVWVPDSEARFMYDALEADPALTLVPVCREGEAIAVAAGLYLGGKRPAVLYQNTGFFEAGDSLRGLALDLHLPLVVLVGYRGYRKDQPMTDSAGVFLEPALRAWGLSYHLVEMDQDVGKIVQAQQEAQAGPRPVAVLICQEYE